MDFKIKSILLWPKDKTKSIRRIDFSLNKINVITGGSERGKSALISIIDYCLASGSCKIPTKNIKQFTDWFGVLFSLGDAELLQARKEPREEQSSGDMFMKEGKSLQIPNELTSNYNVNEVKKRLNNIAGLSDIFQEEDSSSGFESNPSFRDFTSFLFQPQYIIANQSTLFYRADSFEEREKLKNIFPYILNAVDNDYLNKKEELKNIERQIATIERELEKRKNYVIKWLGQLRGYYTQAKELGLLDQLSYPDDSWTNDEYINALRGIILRSQNDNIPIINVDYLAETSKRITELNSKETDLAYQLNKLKYRQELVKKLNETTRIYRENLLNQNNRIESASWLNELVKVHSESLECPFCGTDTDVTKVYLNQIILLKNQIVEKEVRLSDNYSVTSGEYGKITKEVDQIVVLLNNIREELNVLRTESTENSRYLHTLNSIHQFIGKLNSEIENYDSQSINDHAKEILSSLKRRKSELDAVVNSEVIKGRINNAKSKIIASLKHYANTFKAENKDEFIEFNHKDLMLNFIAANGRKDALYEIGSGHNYMAYHVSTLLAFHEFFLSISNHPTPSFIVFDQPTQVYFPENKDDEDADDMTRVKRIFEVVQNAYERTNGRIQIIILEHVGSSAWKDMKDIELIKRWRSGEADNALIPNDWIE